MEGRAKPKKRIHLTAKASTLKPEERKDRKRLKKRIAQEQSRWHFQPNKEIIIKRPRLNICKASNISKTVVLWKSRWENKVWRQKWKHTWGYKRWRPIIRERWDEDSRWKRSWMKSIRRNWWDKKWRRKWMKYFVESRWIARWNKQRLRRKRLFERRWVKSGAKTMGLTFNEFLLIERRQRALQKKQPGMAQRRRLERRMLRAKRIHDQLKQRAINEEKKCLCNIWLGRIFGKDVLGPETFGIRHHAIQYNLYALNLIQGLVAVFLVVVNLFQDHSHIPGEYVLLGLYIIVLLASGLDISGSIFGMITSYHLDRYYGGDIDFRGKTVCGYRKKSNKVHDQFDSATEFRKQKHKRYEDSNASNAASRESSKKRTSITRKTKRAAPEERGKPRKGEDKKNVSPSDSGNKRFKPLGPGASRSYINTTGYLSWIMLQVAWLLNIFFTAYYRWLDVCYSGYQRISAQCNAFPTPKHCDDIDKVYTYLAIVTGVTFALRNILVFVIGMFFRERYLKRCVSNDPYDKDLISTCSDSDIDYAKVPKQILIPHLLSGGKYPYVLPGPTRPVEYMKEMITNVTEQNRALQTDTKNRKGKTRRRILNTYEREAHKLTNIFKPVRRVRVPLEKGKRIPLRIPVPAGVTDTFQLPPELMTDKAWAWLREDDYSAGEEYLMLKQKLGAQSKMKWRRSRKRKIKPVDSDTLTLIDKSDPMLTLPAMHLIGHKMKDLDVRDSTDDSWSQDETEMFVKRSEKVHPVSEDEEINYYLNLMSKKEKVHATAKKQKLA